MTGLGEDAILDETQDDVLRALAAQMTVVDFDRSLARLIALGLVGERKSAAGRERSFYAVRG